MDKLVVIFTDEASFSVHFEDTEGNIFSKIRTKLLEAKFKGKPIGGTYSVQKHTAHVPNTLKHYHVYNKGNEIFAININGTAHDKSHGVRIPNKVADFLRSVNVNVPQNQIIEWLDPLKFSFKDSNWAIISEANRSNENSSDEFVIDFVEIDEEDK